MKVFEFANDDFIFIGPKLVPVILFSLSPIFSLISFISLVEKYFLFMMLTKFFQYMVLEVIKKMNQIKLMMKKIIKNLKCQKIKII